MSGNHAHHPGKVSDGEARARALESLLREKGVLQGDVIDDIVEVYTSDIGPLNGARAVARAWTDPQFRAQLLADGSGTLKAMGFSGMEGENMVVLENTPEQHNVVVCTLCSCYPWPVLGLPPKWYKDAPYRSRVVREPRAVLAEFGTELPEDVQVAVWDSNAEIRYMVLPMRPAGTEDLSEEDLVALVTRDSMIGVTVLDEEVPA